MTIENSAEEQDMRYYWKVYFSFKNYKKWYSNIIYQKLKAFESMKKDDQILLKSFKFKCEKALECISINQEFFDDMLKNTPHFVDEKRIVNPTAEDFDKCVSTLKTIARDWSTSGIDERHAYKPILWELSQIDEESRPDINVFVPGSGLSRLAYEVAKLGFDTTANELTYHMLIPCYFILNTITKRYTIFPFVHNFQNRMNIQDCFAEVEFPDEFPELSNSSFNMVGGEYTEIAIPCEITVSCYFLDTASNIIDYIKCIQQNTQSMWLNVGPLLYHHQQSIELSFEEILLIVRQITDFNLSDQSRIRASYCADPKSMVEYAYNNIYCKFLKNK